MLILAFDTSGFSGSVALLDGPRLIDHSPLEAQRRSAQTLAPAIRDLLAEQKVEPGQIRLVATTVGPGSFTGLRVGVTTAKAFAYAIGAEAIGVSTLEAIAGGVPADLLRGQPRELYAVLDAQRGELFVGRFRSSGADIPVCQAADAQPGVPRLTRLEPDRIIPVSDWLASLPAGTNVTGTGLKKLAERLPASVKVVQPELRDVQAAVVGQLAWRDYSAGRRDDLWKLAPVYLRPSYAEEQRK